MVLPLKKEDPGCFMIFVDLRGASSVLAHVDQGSGVNMIPRSLFERLDLPIMVEDPRELIMADGSSRKPFGFVEDVIVQVEDYIFSLDFTILDTSEGRGEVLILGQPFLATSRAKIDFDKGYLTLRIGVNHLIYNMNRSNAQILPLTPKDVEVCDMEMNLPAEAQFEDVRGIDQALIELVSQKKYGGTSQENLCAHMAWFFLVCRLEEKEGEDGDELKLKLFPYSLSKEARRWVEGKSDETCWRTLLKQFCERFLP